MNIALLKNPRSKYSVLNHMEDELQKAFLNNGVACQSFELTREGISELFLEVPRGKISCTLAFNAMVEPCFFYDDYKVPHIFISVDSPFWHAEDSLRCQHFIPFFPDIESQQYCEKAYGVKTFCFQHACSLSFSESSEKTRDIPFFFPGSYLDDEQEQAAWVDAFGEKLAAFLVEEVEHFLEKADEGYFVFGERVYEAMKSRSTVVPSKQLFFRSIDTYVRGLGRFQLFSSLSGEKVHLAAGKESFVRYQKRFPKVSFQYEGELSFKDLFSVFPRVQTILHCCPTLRSGLHERVLYGLSFGCGLYSNMLNSLPSWLERSGIVSFYDQHDPFPRNPTTQELVKIRKWIEEEHTWDVRVQNVLKNCWPLVEKLRCL